MIICEKCGIDYANPQIETVQVELKDTLRRHAALCHNCWDTIAPGEWVKLPEEDGIVEEARRLYWPCDLCHDVYRYDGVRVLVRLTQTPPRTEYIVCAECTAKDSSLQPKPIQEPEETQATPEPAAEAVALEAQLQKTEPELAPMLEEAQAALEETAPEEKEQAKTTTQRGQSGWQTTVQTVIETIITTATETYKRLRKD